MPRESLIQYRRGTAAEWTAANPVLAAGEVGFETDINIIKIGDGTTAWSSLDYIGSSSFSGSATDSLLSTVNSSNLSATHKITRSATIVVAASDSSAKSKAQADYVCDGTADNVEIQAAINALPLTGGRVIILSGNYSLTADIEFKDNTQVYGEGINSTILTIATGTVFYVYEVNNVKISGCRAVTTAGDAFNIGHSNNITVVDCHVTCGPATGNADSFGFHIHYSSFIYVDRCTVAGNDPSITNRCKCFNPSGGARKVYITNCYATTRSDGTEKSANGIEIDDDVLDLYVDHFCAENVYKGVDIHTHGETVPTCVTISNSKFRDTATDAVSITGVAALNVPRLVLENISVDGSASRGIFLSCVTGAQIIGASINTCTAEGIRAQDSSYITISNPHIANCTYGVYDIGSNVKIMNPNISSCSTCGVGGSGVSGIGGVVVKGGVINACAKGVYARDNPLIEGVHISNSTTLGIEIYSSTYSRILGNHIYNSGTHGIHAAGSASGMIVDDNTVVTCVAGRCIFLSEGGGNNTVVNNFVSGSSLSSAILGGTGSIVKNNNGYVTEARGTATITAGQASVNVSHGLAAAPTRVILTPTTATGGKDFYISAKAASTFTITIDSAHSADISFDWSAVV